ncbi:MAG: type II toxin-antitoxin system RelE/ParE family toxin [Ignavibacteriae bacterium]|nr:type II toxin-antitoxin system RelE/ParE family toxin [Ignavibacteriota bacterium]
MMNFTVEYVETNDGKKPFEEFVLSLSIDNRARLFETVNHFVGLRNQGLHVKENLSKHLEDGIFELRTSFSDRIGRTLYFYEQGARIVLTHGFIKKTQKTPRQEIEKAKELRRLHKQRTKK